MSVSGLAAAQAAMQAHGVAADAIRVFADYYRQLESGAQGYIPESSITPLTEVAALAPGQSTDRERREALAKVAVIKLNGGLGTSMGLAGAKSALAVRGDLTFLDIIARQTLALRRRYDVPLPVIFMNSFRTQAESLAILARYPDLALDGIPLDFVQNAEPKLNAATLEPVSWPRPVLAWCPVGHGVSTSP